MSNSSSKRIKLDQSNRIHNFTIQYALSYLDLSLILSTCSRVSRTWNTLVKTLPGHGLGYHLVVQHLKDVYDYPQLSSMNFTTRLTSDIIDSLILSCPSLLHLTARVGNAYLNTLDKLTSLTSLDLTVLDYVAELDKLNQLDNLKKMKLTVNRDIRWFPSKLPNLEQLTIHKEEHSHRDQLISNDMSGEFPNLQSIELTNMSLTEDDIYQFIKISGLKRLILENCHVRPSHKTINFASVVRDSNLTELHFNGHGNFDDENIKILTEIPTLKSVYFVRRNYYNNSIAERIIRGIEQT